MALGRKPLIGLQVTGIALLTVLVGMACTGAREVVDNGDKPSTSSGSIGGFGDDDDDGGGKTRVPCTKDPTYYDVPGDGCDNDNDGVVDNAPTCDATDDPNPAVAMARAMGICTNASEKGYGLVSAKLTRGYGRDQAPDANQHARMTKFGNVIKPREGKKMAALSTGFAQEFNGQPDKDFSGFGWFPPVDDGTNGLPPGFPQAAEGCAQLTNTEDVIALHLEVKAPKNASGFAFDFDFYTAEWPQFICTNFNDGFIAYVTAKSVSGGAGRNVSFDSRGNPVSVNNGFFDRCVSGVPLACDTANSTVSDCPAGTAELEGTGFGKQENLFLPSCGREAKSTTGGATGWLFSQAPILAEEEFSIDFLIWDTKDTQFDSLVLLDNFRWVLGNVPIEVVTERPPDVK